MYSSAYKLNLLINDANNLVVTRHKDIFFKRHPSKITPHRDLLTLIEALELKTNYVRNLRKAFPACDRYGIVASHLPWCLALTCIDEMVLSWRRLVIVSWYDRAFFSPFMVTFLICKIAQRNLRKNTNIILNSRILLWKTAINRKSSFHENSCMPNLRLMHKVKHSRVPDCVSELFVRKGSAHSPRNSVFVLPRFETIRYGKHSVG